MHEIVRPFDREGGWTDREGALREWEEAVRGLSLLEEAERKNAEKNLFMLGKEDQERIFRVAPYSTYLYFVYAHEGSLIKIGKTDHPKRRLACIRTQSAVPISILAVIRAHERHERMLHDALAKDRVRGEWFRPTPELLGVIERCQDEGIAPVHKFIMDRLAS